MTKLTILKTAQACAIAAIVMAGSITRASLMRICLALVLAMSLLGGVNANAQLLSGPPADPQLKFSTPNPPGVYSPDKVETRFGTLNFFDGFPDKASAEKLYDNLDFQRAVQAYLLAIQVPQLLTAAFPSGFVRPPSRRYRPPTSLQRRLRMRSWIPEVLS